MSTYTPIEPEDRDRLKLLAKTQKRTMMQQISVMLDEKLTTAEEVGTVEDWKHLPPTSRDQILDHLADQVGTEPHAIKRQATYETRKPLPKRK